MGSSDRGLVCVIDNVLIASVSFVVESVLTSARVLWILAKPRPNVIDYIRDHPDELWMGATCKVTPRRW